MGAHHQHVVFNIKGPHCRLHYFYWDEISVQLKDFQPSGKMLNISGRHDKWN